jgi:hypothetical protein
MIEALSSVVLAQAFLKENASIRKLAWRLVTAGILYVN